MRIPPEAVCKVCRRIFCCAECRHKHEMKQHAIAVQRPALLDNVNGSGSANGNGIGNGNGGSLIRGGSMDTIYLFCAICERRPLALHEEMYDEMLAHIAAQHLPLRCRKCAKVYTRIDDFKSFSKCIQPLIHCSSSVSVQEEQHAMNADQTGDTDASKVTVKRAPVAQTTISTQTSPMHGLSSCREADSLSDLTPFSVMHLRWQTKSKITHEEFISGGDSVSSIKNISSINSSAQRSVNGSVTIASSQRVKGKLVRSTSTPVHAGLCFLKPKEQTFNGSGGHVSSIYHSGCESDQSPALPLPPSNNNNNNNIPTSPKQSATETLQRYRKMNSRSKLAAQTPLRQVMSKSIQKAMAEHGMPGDGVAAAGAAHSPLDLRLTPVRRRVQSTVNTNTTTTTTTTTCLSEVSGSAVASSTTYNASATRTRPSGSGGHVRQEILLASTKQLTTESIVITRTRRLATADVKSDNGSGSGSVSAICNTNTNNNTNSISTSTSQAQSCSIELSNASEKSTSSSSSVYQTCRSVEIITATEVTAEEVYTSCEERSASTALNAMSVTETKQNLLTASRNMNMLAAYTPITRIPGAIINKKLINFETPAIEGINELNTIQTPNAKIGHNEAATVSPNSEKFYTPSATPNSTPMRRGSSGALISDERRPAVSRNLSGHFDVTAMRGRPTYRRMESNGLVNCLATGGERVENVVEYDNDCENDDDNDQNSIDDDGDDDDVDEVFYRSSKLKRDSTTTKTAKTTANASNKEELTESAYGRSWSLGSIMSSVMRLPTLRGSTQDQSNNNSIIKRCASIAGSLVRSKSLTEDEQIKAMKRKRTYTLESGTVSYRTPSSPPLSPSSEGRGATTDAASKRFRIQPRKPIQRMRHNNS